MLPNYDSSVCSGAFYAASLLTNQSRIQGEKGYLPLDTITTTISEKH